MSTHRDDTLTPRGAARRDEMMPELLVAMQRLHRARRRRRLAGGVLAALSLGAASLWLTARPGLVPDPPGAAPGGGTSRISIRTIDDDELLSVLTEIGRPAGLIRCEGRAWLTADVTDEGRQTHEPPPDPAL